MRQRREERRHGPGQRTGCVAAGTSKDGGGCECASGTGTARGGPHGVHRGGGAGAGARRAHVLHWAHRAAVSRAGPWFPDRAHDAVSASTSADSTGPPATRRPASRDRILPSPSGARSALARCASLPLSSWAVRAQKKLSLSFVAVVLGANEQQGYEKHCGAGSSP